MRLSVKRSGGVAGMTQTFEVDTDSLPHESANEVLGLYRALGVEAAGASQKIPDAFSYEFQQSHGAAGATASTSLKCGESPTAHALFDAIRNPAKRR